jgi:tRNA(fMet)-specific endonuclease VapC
MASVTNGVQTQFARAFHKGGSFFTSSVVAFELWYGVSKSKRVVENTRRYKTFFAGPIDVLPFDQGAAQVAGELRARLEASGKPIGAYDLLLAGQAMHHNMTLITANVAEFSRVRGLLWEDWSK